MTTKKPKNQGEENEVFLKAFLLQKMEEGGPVGPLGVIKDLSFGPGSSLPKWLPTHSKALKAKSYGALKKIIPKSAATFKADVSINGKNYSVKYTNAAKAAIVNHTNRKGFLRVCKKIGVDIAILDTLITKYWGKREAGLITEDIKNSDKKSPFRDSKESLKKILEYFLFEGTGSKDSSFPADLILKFSDPINPNTYKIMTRDDALNEMWGELVFSVRSKKGMPKSYNPTLHIDLTPWIRYRPGDKEPKGALHVRT